jgi:hypothetical protein
MMPPRVSRSNLGRNTETVLGVLLQEGVQVTTTETSEDRRIVCCAEARERAVAAARVVADLEHRSAYVLRGLHEGREGERSLVYYVSRHAYPEVNARLELELVDVVSPNLLDLLDLLSPGGLLQ